MNKGRLIGGAICLAAAALLAVLSFALPPDKMVFMVGEANVPLLPAIVLGIVGLVMLVTARESREGKVVTTAREAQPQSVEASAKAALNKRLEAIGWGLFLIMLGGFALVPDALVPRGLWSIGVGVIMLGLNATRYFFQIKMSGFTTFLGVISLLSGVTQLLGLHTLDGPILIIILGVYVILKPWLEKRQLFGKAEES